MRLDGFREAPSHSSLDRTHVDAQHHSFRRGVLAGVVQNQPGQVEGAGDRDPECLHELHRDGDREYGRRRDCPADPLSFPLDTIDVILGNDAVEPTPVDSQGVRDNDGGVCSQIIPLNAGTLFRHAVV